MPRLGMHSNNLIFWLTRLEAKSEISWFVFKPKLQHLLQLFSTLLLARCPSRGSIFNQAFQSLVPSSRWVEDTRRLSALSAALFHLLKILFVAFVDNKHGWHRMKVSRFCFVVYLQLLFLFVDLFINSFGELFRTADVVLLVLYM